MNDYRPAEIKAGVFFLSMIVVLILAIGAVSGLGERFTTSYASYAVETTNSYRLAEEAPVTFSGFPVGYVRNVRIDDKLVKFDLFVNTEVALPKGSIAVFRTNGLLGEQYIDIEPGDGPGAIPPGGQVDVELGASIQDIQNKAKQLVDRANAIVEELRVALLNEETLADIRALPGHLNMLLTDVQATTKEARLTVEESRPRVVALLDNLNGTVEQLDATVVRTAKPLEEAAASIRDTSNSVRSLVEKDATGTVQEARHAIKAVEVEVVKLIQDLEGIVARLEQQAKGTVGKADTVLTDANQVLDGANTVIADTNRIIGDNERNAYIALIRLRRTLANLEVFSEKIAREPSALVFGSEDDDADDEEARAERGLELPFDPDRVGPLGPVKRD